MFTPTQFAQLTAAAWAGPTATIQSSASTCLLPCGYTSLIYTAYYTVSGVQFGTKPAAWGCPFAAIQSALDEAASAGVLSMGGIVAGTAVLAAAAAGFANAPATQEPATCTATPATGPRRVTQSEYSAFYIKGAAPRIVCAVCGCDRDTDPFEVGCDCVWADMHTAAQARKAPLTAHV